MPRQFLEKVTVTGADSATDHREMVRIAQEYPFVEFGILMSHNPPRSRFPRWDWISDLAERSERGSGGELNLSAHFCGQYVRQFLVGQFPNLPFWIGRFRRIQLNTHAESHEYILPLLAALVYLRNRRDQEIIFQLDGNDATKRALYVCLGLDLVISGLHDLSHGAGELPEHWPLSRGEVKMGYAGGLSPDNLEEQLARISDQCGSPQPWIDAETHLRTHGEFDLDKVVKFLEIARPWIKTSS